MTAAAVDVMVVMPVLFRRRGGTGTHSPTVGQDRDGASSQAPTRSLPPALRAQDVSRPADGSPTGQPSQVPAARSGQTGRETSSSNIPAVPTRGTRPQSRAILCAVEVSAGSLPASRKPAHAAYLLDLGWREGPAGPSAAPTDPA